MENREVILEFQVDESTLKEASEDSIVDANAAALEVTYFIMPVRFRLNGVELLGEKRGKESKVCFPHPEHGMRGTHTLASPSCWLPLPLIGFASNGIRILHDVAVGRKGQLSIADAGSLRFSRENDKVLVVSDLNGHLAEGDFVDVPKCFFSVRSEYPGPVPEPVTSVGPASMLARVVSGDLG